MQKTKDIIFDTAVQMFSEKGYDNVSTREIARAAGINESTAYYYYKSKEKFLDDILSVYQCKLERYLITKEQVEQYLKTDTPQELLGRFFQQYKNKDAMFMLRAGRIVFMQQYTNAKVRDLVMDYFQDKIKASIKDALDILIERSMIPAFDTKSISVLWCDFLYSQQVKHSNRFFYGDTNQVKSSELTIYSNMLIDMVVTGRLPESK